jgi:hypothetical protein
MAMSKRFRNLLLTGVSIVLLLSTPVQAKKAFLSDIVLTNTRDDLLVYFSVSNCFTAEMNTAIESGLSTSFTFFVKLYEKRNFLWDRKLADLEISHSIKYDNLKNIYEVRLSEQGNKLIQVKSFDEAKKLMADVSALKVTSTQTLRKRERYQLQMMAQLDKIKLPLYLHYVLFFLSLWDFETDWHTVDFRY